MQIKLDTKTLDNLTLAKANKLYNDDRLKRGKQPLEMPQARVDIGCNAVDGLTVRVTRKRITWNFTYTSPVTGKLKREWLGVYGKEENGAVSVSLAHSKAVGLREGVQNKKDPQLERLAEGPSLTFGEVMEMRLTAEVFGMQKDAKAAAQRCRSQFAHLLELPIKRFQVNPHFNDLIKGYEAKRQHRSIKRVRCDLNCIFDFAVGKKFVSSNPIPKKKKQKCGGGIVVRRAHALSPDRFVALWHKLPIVMERKKEIAIKLMMVTGQRSGEVVGMDASEIKKHSDTNWVWTLPPNVRNANGELIKAGRTKNGHAHEVPLSALAIKLVKEIEALADGPKLFATKGRPMTACNIASALWTAQKKDAFGIGDWTAHMLRHTVLTGMEELGVSKADKSLVANHTQVEVEQKSGSGWAASAVTNGYTHVTDVIAARALRAKRDALDLWAEHLSELVGLNKAKLKRVA